MLYPSPRSSQNLSAKFKKIKINGRPKKEREGKRRNGKQRREEKEREKADEAPNRGSKKKKTPKSNHK